MVGAMKSATTASVKERFERMQGSLNERARRLFAATEALAIGWGGVAIVARATGIALRDPPGSLIAGTDAAA